MNLSNQIKNLRKAKGFSQEELAERIYVSRQTISNWETGRSYPDVQSLLLLSVLFEVSLDDLVKGDIEMMKNTVEVNKMNVITWLMLVTLALGLLILLPCYHLFGYIGLVAPGVLLVIGLVASIVIEQIKKKNNVQTYSEILAFIEGEPLDEEKATQERSRLSRNRVLMALASAAIGVVTLFLGEFIFITFFW